MATSFASPSPSYNSPYLRPQVPSRWGYRPTSTVADDGTSPERDAFLLRGLPPGFDLNRIAQVNPRTDVGQTSGPGDMSAGPAPTSRFNFQPGPAQSSTPNPIGYDPDERDAYNLWLKERQWATGRGDAREADFNREANTAGSMRSGYDQLTAGLYGDIWGGGGGYTPEQQREIRGQAGLDRLQWTPEMGQENFLTGDEQTAIAGDPYAAFDYLAGQTENLEGQRQAGNARIRSRFDEGSGAVRGALDRMDEAASDPSLEMSQDYEASQRESLGDSAGRIRSSLNDPGLSVTDRYLKESQIGDNEVNDMENAAAATARGRYQSAVNSLRRDAATAGMSNPLAVAAMRKELEMEGAGDAADAATRGRLQARLTQAERAQSTQDTQLGAAGQRANLTRSAELPLAEMGIGISRDVEGTRLSTANRNSDRRMGAAGARVDAEGRLLSTGTGMESDIAAGDTDFNTWLQGNLANSRQTGEGLASGRAAGVASNRQQTNQGNQNQQWNRGWNINNAESDRAGGIAAVHQDVQREGRGASTGQQQYFSGRELDYQGNRLRNDELTQQGRQGAVSGYAGWGTTETQTGFGNQFMNNFGRSMGSAAGNTIGSFGRPQRPSKP